MPRFHSQSVPGCFGLNESKRCNLLDLLVPVLALFSIFTVAGLGIATGNEAGTSLGALLGFFLFVAYVIWALVLLRGTTPSKYLLGIRVIKEDGRQADFLTMLIREWVGKWISGLVLGLGFLFYRDNQAWHDRLMRTYMNRTTKRGPERRIKCIEKNQ